MNVMTFLPHRCHLLRVLVAVVLGLLLLALPSVQATAFGSAIRITTNTGASRHPSVAAVYGTPLSYVYVAWQDNTPVSGSGGKPEIWMRASSNNGVSFGSAIRISTNTGNSTYPSVAATGSYVYVAWMDYTPVTGSSGKPEIWMRVSANNAASFGSAIRMSTNTGYSGEPSVAADGSHVYVAWEDNTTVTGSGVATEIWMRISSNNGVSFGSPIRITTNTGFSLRPSVAAVGSNVYIAWDDSTPVSGSGGSSEIWMRVSANNGASFGSAIRITTNTGNSMGPSVAADGNHVYVAWQDDTLVTGSGDKPEIWMRVSGNNGASFGSAVRISTNTYDSQLPSVAAVASYVWVAWYDNTPVPGNGGGPPYADEIWMRESANNGGSFGSAIRITTNSGWSDFPCVVSSGPYVYVAWDDNTPVTGSGGSYEIWMRIGS